MRYAIIGTGALGGFYGGMLAKSGADVHFLFNNDYDHVVKYGLRVDSVLGNFHLYGSGQEHREGILLNAYKSANEMPKCDVIVVTLKTINNFLLKKILPPLLHSKSTVILVQNGLGMEENLSKEFPGVAIAGGMAFICSVKKGPGHIEHAEFGELTVGGHVNVDMKVLERFRDDLVKSGLPAKTTDDLNDFRWRKLVWNIPYNGLTVILNAGTDQLMEDPDSRQLVNDLMVETITAANRCGAHIQDEFAQKMLDYTDSMLPYKPSMKLDFDHNRKMEIEYIYSNPIRAAAAHGFKMEKTSVVEQQLKFLEKSFVEAQ